MQKVTVECQSCEAVETIELDGCVILGWTKDGKLYYRRHDIDVGETIASVFRERLAFLINQVVEGKNE